MEQYKRYTQEVCSRLLVLRKAQNHAGLKDTLVHNYQKRVRAVCLLYDVLPDAPVEKIAFEWNYYTERPSVGFAFAMKLLREIYANYKPLEFLPSIAAISKQYALPVITVRRAIKILNDIKVVESINGKGTRVMAGSGTTVPLSCLAIPEMKKVLLPYLQSAQILLIICKDVVKTVFPALPDDAVQSSIAWLRDILASGDYSLTFGACFKPFIQYAQSPSLKEILQDNRRHCIPNQRFGVERRCRSRAR